MIRYMIFVMLADHYGESIDRTEHWASEASDYELRGSTWVNLIRLPAAGF